MPRIIVPKNVLAQELGDEIVLLQLETEMYYSLNPTGSRLWKLMTHAPEFDFDRIIQQLGTLYGVEEEKLQQDMQALLDDLVQEGLIGIEKEPA